MNDRTALVRAVLPRPGGFSNPFFREAYRAARGDNQPLIESDGEKLAGCLVHIATDGGLNPTIAEGLRASTEILHDYLSLGLSEAAQDNMADAVALLRARPIDLFVQLGQGLHREIREGASQARSRSVLRCVSGLYGIWNPTMEAEIATIADPRTRFGDCVSYTQAKGRIERGKNEIDLSRYFPLDRGLDHGAYYVDFQREAYRRRDKETPNTVGSIFHLFLRSFLLRMLSGKRAWEASDRGWYGSNIPEFLDFHFVTSASLLKNLIQDLFFDPERVDESIPMVFEGLRVYLGTGLKVWSSEGGVYEKLAVRSQRLLQTAEQLAKDLLREFGQEVRDYYKDASGVEVTPEDLTRFWYPRVLTRAGGGGSGGEVLPLVGEADIAGAGFVPDTEALIQTAPEEIAKYLHGASRWPEAARRAFIARYDWNGLFSRMGDPNLFDSLVVIVRELGPEMLYKFDHKRLTFEFWYRAWEEREALRDAILQFFREDRYTRKINARILLNAIEEASFGHGEDTRLLDLLITRILRDEPSNHLESGVGLEKWNKVLFVLSSKPNSLRSVWPTIPPRLREPALAHFTRDDRERVLRIVGVIRDVDPT